MSWLSFLGGLLGCRDRPPTVDSVLKDDGRVIADTDGPLAMPVDRHAIAELLHDAGVSAEDVVVLSPEGSTTRASWVRVGDARVVGVALAAVRSSPDVDLGHSLAQLDGLREARLRGRFQEIAVDDGPSALESLNLSSSDESLRRIVVHDLPQLRELTVHGARPESLSIENLPGLESLDLTACALPTLDAVVGGLEPHPLSIRRLSLAGNELTDDAVADLGRLVDLDRLEELSLSGNRITSLAALPPLPALRTLSLSGNPLRPDLGLETGLADDRLPRLERLELRRTGIGAVPATLAPRVERQPRLRVSLDETAAADNEIRRTLERLREVDAARPGERRAAIGRASGTLRGRQGTCRWSTGTSRRAEVRCTIHVESVRGTAAVRLGTTDPAMPFQGGGTPRLRATLGAGEGAVALWVHERVDHVETVRVITDFERSAIERHAVPDDRFEGYRRVVARPGEPATVDGEPVVLGSEVRVWLEAVDGEARGVELVVEPPP